MKITTCRLGLLRAPLRTPFKTALRTVEEVEDLVVALDTDTGHVGYGSAPATAVITGDTHGSIRAAINGHIAPRITGMPMANLNAITSAIQGALERNPSAKSAMEIAVYDLWGQLHGTPLYQLLGGGEPVLATDITISVDAIDKMVEDAVSAVERGFGALKIKVGKDIGTDIERARAIHAAVAGRALLRLDANQGWTPKQAVHAIHALEDAGVHLELVEQPVPARDLDGLRYVTERVHTPVMADESVFGPREGLALMRMGAADIINIKLAKTGGISNALKLADIAQLHGVECMMGCMLESALGVAAAAHVAVARSQAIGKIDLDGPSLCAVDPVHCNVTFDGAEIAIGDAPGLGVEALDGVEWFPADR